MRKDVGIMEDMKLSVSQVEKNFSANDQKQFVCDNLLSEKRHPPNATTFRSMYLFSLQFMHKRFYSISTHLHFLFKSFHNLSFILSVLKRDEAETLFNFRPNFFLPDSKFKISKIKFHLRHFSFYEMSFLKPQSFEDISKDFVLAFYDA